MHGGLSISYYKGQGPNNIILTYIDRGEQKGGGGDKFYRESSQIAKFLHESFLHVIITEIRFVYFLVL